MEGVRGQYTKVLNEMVEKVSTITDAQWLWCSRLNGTYLDCPISKYSKQDLLIMVHNPAKTD